MEEPSQFDNADGEITGIRFGLASHQEICTASVSGSAISHASQLANPYLGLPLEFGKCESCGTSDPGNCEGHFGYIELPIPIYHPSHVSELRRMLTLLCMKCMKFKKNKFPSKAAGIAEQLLAPCCEDASLVSVGEIRKDGYCYLQLKVASKRKLPEGFWNFLHRFGFRYGGVHTKRTLLPCEVLEMLKKIPEDSRKKLVGKGFSPQDGYILRYLPVPPNCLSVPEISDGITVMSTDPATAMLRKVLRQIEVIKSSRSLPNFESLEVEANELQLAVDQYLQARGTVRAPRTDTHFGVNKDENNSSRKVWLEKMKTLFIRKGSGFSSRSVITGDSYKAVNEVGVPYEIAQRITLEERVSQHNMKYLQELVDNKLCLTYRDGSSMYSLKEGSKGHTFLKPGQIVHRRIMDGDIVFINRPPTTHKHSLQALKVYVHDDHTVKINPLICGPLSADFDGDCVHLFYPQSTAAKAEVLELFALEKQILSSHSGNLIMQLASDSLLSLKLIFKTYFVEKIAAQQLAMFTSLPLPPPAFWLTHSRDPFWTALQILQTALPASFSCNTERFLIKESEILVMDFVRDAVSVVVNDIGTCICFEKGSDEVLNFFNSLQPLLMENVFAQGFSVGLEDFSISQESIRDIQKDIQGVSQLLYHLRSTYNELVELQLENQIRFAKAPITRFILRSSSLGSLIDSKSEGAVNKLVQQIGFLGLQISDRGKFYSKTLVEDVSSLYKGKYPENFDYTSAEYGFISGCFFRGLDPYEEMVHSISTREVIVRSSRGLSEPGTLFKNLMAILRDVVICYDGTVRNVCSNSIIQFEYGNKRTQSLYPPGEPVGVLAATSMSNPAYKAVLDATPSSNSSWEFMKEILLCKANFNNELIDRRIILYLNDCGCGRNFCQEKAAYLVKNQLTKVSLKDTAVEFLIEYRNQASLSGELEISAGLVGHVHLNERLLKEKNISMLEILQKCEETINSFRKKKKVGGHLKKAVLSVSEGCSFHKSCSEETCQVPCLLISLRQDVNYSLETSSQILADSICPFLLETIIKGDTRICSANITWTSPDSITWIRNPQTSDHGELAVDVCLEKSAVKQSGDAWRIVLDTCLPVLHLIDTRRSIPYGIKQIEKLLGISCVFDQAVQRLSTSVSSVSKGVLKEHLILLANSMSCAGNLIGFNSGGYKALSKSLNVQVPFTEATLITPKKCFERAAEKCHVDSLTSIVASCSWGKHVAVGTGSRFDILWDTRGVEFNQEGGVDVHNFLHMVGTANGEETMPGCLGVDVDGIMEVDVTENCQSPENDNADKPVFEDSQEFLNLSEKDLTSGSGWETISSKDGSGSGNDWSGVAKSNNWSSGAKSNDWSSGAKSNDWSGGDKSDDWASGSKSNDWSSGAKSNDWSSGAKSNDWSGGNKSNDWASGSKSNDWSSGAKSNDWSGGAKSSDWASGSKSNNWSSGRGNQAEDNISKEAEPVTDTGTGWGRKSQEPSKESNSWNAPPARGTNNASEDGGFRSKGWNSTPKATTENASSGWNKERPENSGWNSNPEKKTESASWSNTVKNKNQTLAEQGKESGGWDGKAAPKNSPSSWSDSIGKEDQPSPNRGRESGGWDNNVTAKNATSSWSGGVREESEPLPDQGRESGGWESKVASKKASSSWLDSDQPPSDQGKESGGWGDKVTSFGGSASDSEGWTKSTKPSLAVETESPAGNSSWVKQNSPGVSQASVGWQSPRVGDGLIENQWEKRGSFNNRRSESPGRWGADSADWKIKKNRPNNIPGGNAERGSSLAPLFTQTRQRLDMFTTEEHDVLSLVEPIMKSIRRIMHQSGGNDGDPIPAEDQAYLTENVFNYHPEKDAKMGSGIDHFMVSKHGNFTESRCFYVVSTDGRKEDFSYRKCLGNLVKTKYPEIAEEFIAKYFQKPRAPGGGGNRERNSNPDLSDTGKAEGSWDQSKKTQGGWGSRCSTPEPSETQKTKGGWGGDSTTEPPETRKTQGGWGGQSSTPEPSETQKTKGGWGSDSTTEPPETRKTQGGWGAQSSTPEPSETQKTQGGWGGGSTTEPPDSEKSQGCWGGVSSTKPSESEKKTQGNWG